MEMTTQQNNHHNIKKPVIMQVIPELGPGGAEQGCIDMTAALVGAGAEALVICHGGSRIHEIARAGGTHIDMPVHSKNPLTIMQNTVRLKSLIKKYDVDIVHARSRAPAWSCYHACKNAKVRFVTTCHAPYNISGNTKKAYNASIAKGERVIAISQYVANYLTSNYKIDPRNLRVIARGIALEKFHPTAVTPERLIKLSRQWRVPDAASVIMLPGRLTRWKGHHILIDAIPLLKHRDIFCLLIGSDQGRTGYRLELEEKIRDNRLEGKIRIIDHCEDMPAAYMLANVIVSASTDPEGFGRVPVEAQAMGKPVIATDHGGAQETILRGETGWLIPPGQPEAMATAIDEALSLKPGQRSILATRAMAHVAAHFTREQMTDSTLGVYAELLAEKQTGDKNKLEQSTQTGPLNLRAAG